MKTIIITLIVSLALILTPQLALAGCTTTLVNGTTWCTTCCVGSLCSTTCS